MSSSSAGGRTRAARTARGSCGRSGSRTSAPSVAGSARSSREIEAGTFGNVYKGSSLETVVGSIAEQRQIFKGADHAFLWKPKLRIPDIYENRDEPARVRALPRHLRAAATARSSVVAAIRRSTRATDQGPRAGGGEPALLPAPDARPPVQHGDREGLQRADRRQGEARPLGRVPRDARRASSRSTPRYRDSAVERPRRDRRRCSSTSARGDTRRRRATATHAARRAGGKTLARVREESATQAKALDDGPRERPHAHGDPGLAARPRARARLRRLDRGERSEPGVRRRQARRRLPGRAARPLRRLAGRRGRAADRRALAGARRAAASRRRSRWSTRPRSTPGIVRMLDLALGGGAARCARSSSSRPTIARTRSARSWRARRSAASATLAVRYLPYGELERNRDVDRRASARGSRRSRRSRGSSCSLPRATREAGIAQARGGRHHSRRNRRRHGLEPLRHRQPLRAQEPGLNSCDW